MLLFRVQRNVDYPYKSLAFAIYPIRSQDTTITPFMVGVIFATISFGD
jgi:hypothetical protein